MSKSHSQSHYISSCSGKPHRDIGGSPPCHLAGTPSLQTLTNTAHKIPTGFSRQYETFMSLNSNAHAELPWWLHNITTNLVPRSHSVTGNVRSGKVRQYAIFHWPLKKGCGNAIYAPIGLFRGARDEGLVFASSCAVLNKYQLCGGKFFFFRRRKSFTVKENHFKNLRRLCKWYRRKLHVSCHLNKVLRSLIRGTQKLINSS